MGHRADRALDDAYVDATLQRAFAELGEELHVLPPGDLVTRTARRLPREAPAHAARRAARRRMFALFAWLLVFGLISLIGVMSIWGTFGAGPKLAFLLGDGGSGFSRVLLILQLLVKPILLTVAAMSSSLVIGGLVALFCSVWLWWWLLRRTPAYAPVEEGP